MKKIIQSNLIDDYEVLTDNGWENIVAIHKTIQYNVFIIKTKDVFLKCADFHILFDKDMNEIFVKNLKIGNIIKTKHGDREIIEIIDTNYFENMYDIELDYNSNERYYTNDILSHNTTYIKYLTSLIEDKDIIFIPPSTAEALSEPSIIPFLMEHRNSILIIEDAEKVISDRENGGSSIGVSNILNLTDGILGDCLNIQIIATFNMRKEKIDKALLRKGRLIAEHKFTNLTIDESNNLLKHIGKDKKVNTPMSLADIYNIDSEDMRFEKIENKIGFS